MHFANWSVCCLNDLWVCYFLTIFLYKLLQIIFWWEEIQDFWWSVTCCIVLMLFLKQQNNVDSCSESCEQKDVASHTIVIEGWSDFVTGIIWRCATIVALITVMLGLKFTVGYIICCEVITTALELFVLCLLLWEIWL